MSVLPLMPGALPALDARLERIRQRIHAAALRAGRSSEEVRLIAVTKTFGAGVVRAAYSHGLSDFGENYVQEAVKKIALLAGEGARPTWHLIGHLQTNKVKAVMGTFAWVHSVDRLPLLEALARVCRESPAVPELLLQVNLEEDRSRSTKFGFDPAAVEEALRAAAQWKLPVKGLMTFPPYFDDPERARPYYARLRALRDKFSRADWGETVEVRELSMGMSGDFEVAIEEGATLVRIGTALFGARTAKPPREGQDGPERGGAREKGVMG